MITSESPAIQIVSFRFGENASFAGGFSDNDGFVVRVGYAPVRNWVINATYFLNNRNVDVPNGFGQTEVDYNRLQVDFNVKF